MPSVPGTSRTARTVVAVALVGACAALGTPFGVAAGSARATCDAVTDAARGRWARVPTPTGVVLASVESLDRDPCVLVAADEGHGAWRSIDGGTTWRKVAGAPPLTRVLAARLGRPGNGAPAGPVLGVGPASGTAAAQVFVSADRGAGYAPATAGPGAPLLADLTAAASGAVDDAPVYALGRSAATPVATGTVLLRSTDNGATFAPVAGAARLLPTTLVVSPADPNEVWVNHLPPGGGGGAWVSADGGETFRQACCAAELVNDVDVVQGTDGVVATLLATDHGLRRSVDGGQSWDTITTAPVTGVRGAAGGSVVVQTAEGVSVVTGARAPVPLPGLPATCRPSGLRSGTDAPAVLLVDCAHGTYRVVLGSADSDRPDGGDGGDDGGPGATPPPPPPPNGSPADLPPPEPMVPLAVRQLPGAAQYGGAVAFDGTRLYYDAERHGEVGVINVKDGTSAETLRLGVSVFGMTFDLKRQQLIFTTSYDGGDLQAYDIRTGTLTALGRAPDKAPSYDASIDGLSWVPESGSMLYRAPRATGLDQPRAVCTITGHSELITSSYVASGDGGGYVQTEDDATLYRVGPDCRILAVYVHRAYSEANYENDSLPCDAQTFFPKTAIWVRDTAVHTATAFAVPAGYCPMASRLTLTAPATIGAHTATTVCATLANAVTGVRAAGRVVTLRADGALLGRTALDAAGTGCVPLAAGGPGKIALTAAFAGDSSLYAARATGTIAVPGSAAVPLVRPVPPLPQPPAPPAAPAEPLPAPGGNPVPAPGGAPAPAPNAAQAAQGQAQGQAQAQTHPVANGVVVQQRQTQPHLALALAQQELNTAQDHAMVAVRRERPDHTATFVAGGLLLVALCGAATSLRQDRSLQPERAAPTRRRTARPKRRETR
ncbi:MAG: Photosynthesis system assembly factor [Frankiaceae bacterium]|jgi:hypothetical protein|nr:Photosynthesis system assembly factor [Frankiaceae bacterium]